MNEIVETFSHIDFKYPFKAMGFFALDLVADIMPYAVLFFTTVDTAYAQFEPFYHPYSHTISEHDR